MFCDISPTCYKIALQKEIIKRHIKNFLRHERYADTRQSEPLPCLVADCSSHLIKRGKGIDPVLQENKAVNIKLANARMNGILIRPGETFSFWHLVGKTTKRKGYRDGRILVRNHLLPGIGGGLCNLANTIHRVVLLSPLTVTEFHKHSDALAPDEGPRVPFSSSCCSGAMRTICTPPCGASTRCRTPTASWRRDTTSSRRVTNTTVYRRFTKKHWTETPWWRKSWCWITTRKSCMITG